MKVEIEKELLEKHSDQEIIAFLYKVVSGIAKNYSSGLSANNSKYLWGSYGDIVLVRSILGQMKQRDEAIEAQRQSMLQ